MKLLNLIAMSMWIGLNIGCTPTPDPRAQDLQAQVALLKQSIEDLKPGLGEIMATIHLHHAKLYFAGQKQNWDLAAYQLDEIKEGLDQATELHDHFKEVKASLKELRHLTDQSLASLEAAIKEKNEGHFANGFKALTASCNQCHTATGNPFIVVQIPTAPMFSNQKF